MDLQQLKLPPFTQFDTNVNAEDSSGRFLYNTKHCYFCNDIFDMEDYKYFNWGF
jgi:hypothetical protein